MVRILDYHDICLFCMQSIDEEVDQFWRCHGCDQAYHNQHISIWVQTHDDCPNCRQTLQLRLIQYYRYYRKRGYQLNTLHRQDKVTDPRVFDIKTSQTLSKAHISYFQMSQSVANNACSCEDWRYSLLDDFRTQKSYYHKFGEGFLLYGFNLLRWILLMFILFVLIFDISIDRKTELILFPLYFITMIFYLAKFLSRIYDRLNCPLHRIINLIHGSSQF